MRAFFRQVERAGLRFVWEPRGAWPKALVAELCSELGLIHCVDPFQNEPAAGDVAYFRLHGLGGCSYRYTDADLEKLARLTPREPAYVLFNNKSMREDAERFLRLTGESLSGLPRTSMGTEARSRRAGERVSRSAGAGI
jgi:uncharacterized protein YecE (DUF72 family)